MIPFCDADDKPAPSGLWFVPWWRDLGVNMDHETLTSASNKAAAAAHYLQSALTGADAVAALVLLPIISDAHKLQQSIDALLQAVQSQD